MSKIEKWGIKILRCLQNFKWKISQLLIFFGLWILFSIFFLWATDSWRYRASIKIMKTAIFSVNLDLNYGELFSTIKTGLISRANVVSELNLTILIVKKSESELNSSTGNFVTFFDLCFCCVTLRKYSFGIVHVVIFIVYCNVYT